MALTPFRHVTGVDPSANMIYAARKKIVENKRGGVKAGSTIDFVQGSAEKLDFLPDDSTDLVIAGTYLQDVSSSCLTDIAALCII